MKYLHVHVGCTGPRPLGFVTTYVRMLCTHVLEYRSVVESAPTSVHGFAVQTIVLVWFVASGRENPRRCKCHDGASTLFKRSMKCRWCQPCRWKTTTRGTLSMTSRVCQAWNSTSPKRGGSSDCAGTSSWQKNIHSPSHVGQSMASRRGRSSVDPHRDHEHVSNTNSEGTLSE